MSEWAVADMDDGIVRRERTRRVDELSVHGFVPTQRALYPRADDPFGIEKRIAAPEPMV